MSLELSIFVLVVLAVVGWFAVGTHYNVRKGEAVLRWLQDGLPLIGEKTTLRWLGSSAVELKIQNPRPPFREAEVLVLLDPRDVPLIWLFSRMRGRSDLLIVRGSLRNPPRREIAALDLGAWSAQRNFPKYKEWETVSAPAPFTGYSSQKGGDATALVQASILDGCKPVLIAERRQEPNLEVQWKLEDARKHSAREVFEAVQRVAQT